MSKKPQAKNQWHIAELETIQAAGVCPAYTAAIMNGLINTVAAAWCAGLVGRS